MKKINFHWGWKIAFVYSGFAIAMIGAFIYASGLNHTQLVKEDYYVADQEMNQHIERVNNTLDLDHALDIRLDRKEGEIVLSFPQEMNQLQGDILLYRPSNADMDQELEIDVDEIKQQHIDASKLTKGRWRVKVQWQNAEVPYYSEAVVFIY